MNITHITKENFEREVTESQVPVLVDFWAEWCGPCRMLEPVIRDIAAQLSVETAKVCKINIDEQPELAMHHRVASIPTLVLFKNGTETARKVGFQPKEAILSILE